MPFVYQELHGMAERLMSGQREGHTLQPTALLNEAYLRLVEAKDRSYEDRRHFMRVAARAMRSVLVDYARRRNAQKRRGDRASITFDESLAAVVEDADHVLAVDGALERLGRVDPQLAEIVELKFFGGLTNEDVGAALGIALRTVERGWRLARAWLRQDLQQDLGDGN